MRKNGEIDPVRYCRMKMARDFFFRCLRARADYLAVENPLPMAIAQLPNHATFSHRGLESNTPRKTLYWLKNLPPIMPTKEHSAIRTQLTRQVS